MRGNAEVEIKRTNIQKSRYLRRNQTEAERKLWAILKNRQLGGVKFRRQFSVGKYILDFYCPEHKLGIEADGGQHYKEEDKRKDEIRTKELCKQDIEILRFSDLDILNNADGVSELIQKAMVKKKLPPHHIPLPQGERNGNK